METNCKVRMGEYWTDGMVIGEQTKNVGLIFKRQKKYYLVSYNAKYLDDDLNYCKEDRTRLFKESDVIRIDL